MESIAFTKLLEGFGPAILKRKEQEIEQRGRLIGRIQSFQEMLRLPVTAQDALGGQTIEQLEALADELRNRVTIL